MKAWTQFVPTAVLISAMLLALPTDGLADKDGKPNKKSIAVTAACLIDDQTARVCSCKEISNVVLRCGDTYVKHEDVGVDKDTGVETDKYQGIFGCVDSDGETVSGSINLVAVKSGSQKNAKPKHRPGDYTAIEDAPPGSGLFFGPVACTEDFACPAKDDCTADDGSDDGSDDEPPILN